MAAVLDFKIDTAADLESQGKALIKRLQQLKPGEYNLFAFGRRKRRTLPANAYYWGVLLQMIAEETGNDANDLHEHFKKQYNPAIVRLKDEFSVVGGSTAKLDSRNFKDYTDLIKQWALDFLNLRIPAPNEVPDDIYLDLIQKGFIK